MTVRFGPSLITGKTVFGVNSLGVLGSQVPSTGQDGPGFLFNDLVLPADATKEVRGFIESFPAAGTFTAEEDSSFTFSGAPNGLYTFSYRYFLDGVDQGTATAYLTVGFPSVVIFNIATDDAVFSGGATGYVQSTCSFNLTVSDATFAGSAQANYTPTGPVYSRPVADIAATGWAPSTGGALWDMLDEAAPDDADYIYRPASGVESVVLQLAPPLPIGLHRINIRMWIPAGTGQFKCTLANSAQSNLGETAWQNINSTPSTYALPVTCVGIADRVRIDVVTT